MLSDEALAAKYPGNAHFDGVLLEDRGLPFNIQGNDPSSPVLPKDALYPEESDFVPQDGPFSPRAQIHGFNTQGPSVQYGDPPLKEPPVERDSGVGKVEMTKAMLETIRKMDACSVKHKDPK